MSAIVDFYRETAPDSEGRMLSDLLAYKNLGLEHSHDVIQWLFPLEEPSNFNVDAPLLTKEDIELFKSDPLLQANLLRSYYRILNFFGLEEKDGVLFKAEHFHYTIDYAWRKFNHNYLRISRIIACMRILGKEDMALQFYQKVKEFYDTQEFPIPENTFNYWTHAILGTKPEGIK
jgi:hypothetical protein